MVWLAIVLVIDLGINPLTLLDVMNRIMEAQVHREEEKEQHIQH
jgi:hypothetical protein